jgi:electron transfer flavoprotein beta subunit
MHIIVCVKQVVDPEEPPTSFKVDSSANKIVLPPGVPSVISPFDRQAVEAALRIKDVSGGKVTAVSLGANLDKNVVRDPLALGIDELILLEDEAFADGDSWSTAYALSMTIKKIGTYDLILCGRQASDWDGGQVGSGIAEMLGIPIVTVARKIEAADGKAKVERVTTDGYEVVETPLPALVTVSNELGEPRYPTIKQVMASKKKQLVIWKPADIGVNVSRIGGAGRRTRLLKLFQPVQESRCELIGGKNPAEAGANLALRLREVGLL